MGSRTGAGYGSTLCQNGGAWEYVCVHSIVYASEVELNHYAVKRLQI